MTILSLMARIHTMFLDDRTVYRSSLFEGLKLADHQQDALVGLCRFGQAQSFSLLVIAQNLDKILIYDLTSFKDRLLSGRYSQDNEPDASYMPRQESAVSYISIKDRVIESLAVVEIGQKEGSLKDLLLIGCSSSIMIYDTLNQEHLFSVNTSSKITTISVASSGSMHLSPTRLLFCGGIQKLYAYQMDCSNANAIYPIQTPSATGLVNLELSSERTISETVSCLIYGRFCGLECLIVGFHENRIKVFTVDSLEQSIQGCRLTLNESAKINCLCAIETIQLLSEKTKKRTVATSESQQHRSALPPVVGGEPGFNQTTIAEPQMNYFAYGLESGCIGVIRLLAVAKESNSEMEGGIDGQDESQQEQQQQVAMFGERLWRHKSKQTPVSVSLFDIDGDGMDELIVGYKNGRLEFRSPFTGQLLTSTRCFRSSGHLVGLVKWSLERVPTETLYPLLGGAAPTTSSEERNERSPSVPRQEILVAVSSLSSLVAFRPHQRRPRQALTDYLANSMRDHTISYDSLNRRDEEMHNFNMSVSDANIKPADMNVIQPRSEQTGDDIQHLLECNDSDEQSQNWPISSESRQNPKLLQEIGLVKKRQVELRQQFRQIYRELLREQMAISQTAMSAKSGSSAQSGPVRLAHCWNFDETNKKLVLTLMLDSVLESFLSIEMIEIVDSNERLISGGHLVINPVKVSDKPVHHQRIFPFEQSLDSKEALRGGEVMPKSELISADLVLGSAAIEQQRRKNCDKSELTKPMDEPIELRLSIFLSCGVESQKRSRKSATLLQNVLERTVVLPKFAMFVPESLTAINQFGASRQRLQKKPMMRKVFVLPERTNKLQFGHMLDHQNQIEAHDNEELWLHNGDHNLDAGVMLSMRQFSANSKSSNGAKDTGSQRQEEEDAEEEEDEEEERGEEDDEEEDEGFEFVDLRTIDQERLTASRRFRLTFEAKVRRLTVESDDSDLLVELIRLLVIERLQLNIRDHSVDEKDLTNVDVLLNELAELNKNSRQLEESERRIQTEIYEAAELIKSLMQQLSVANELNEFGISRDLLAEISMMLNGTQNSAQAFYLNNRRRLNLMKQANCLREKVLFLTGDESIIHGC